jgi:hypothetical protein
MHESLPEHTPPQIDFIRDCTVPTWVQIFRGCSVLESVGTKWNGYIPMHGMVPTPCSSEKVEEPNGSNFCSVLKSHSGAGRPKHDFYCPNQNQHMPKHDFLCKSKSTQAKINKQNGRSTVWPSGVLVVAGRACLRPRVLDCRRASAARAGHRARLVSSRTFSILHVRGAMLSEPFP